VAPEAVAPASVAFFSPSGDHLAWIDYSGADNALWVADDSFGTKARLVTTGDLSGAHFSADSRFLIVLHWGEKVAMGVVDLQQDQLAEQQLTDSGWTATLGARRLLALTAWNTQDLSGRLELIDLVTGTRTLIAEPVTDFALAGSVDAAATLAYAVHTRFPSDHDGLWLTTLPEP
jgi:hypothetical protein